jgi:hypothetical protein
MQPPGGQEFGGRCLSLGYFIRVVDWNVIDPSGVDVERDPQIAGGHR